MVWPSLSLVLICDFIFFTVCLTHLNGDIGHARSVFSPRWASYMDMHDGIRLDVGKVYIENYRSITVKLLSLLNHVDQSILIFYLKKLYSVVLCTKVLKG